MYIKKKCMYVYVLPLAYRMLSIVGIGCQCLQRTEPHRDVWELRHSGAPPPGRVTLGDAGERGVGLPTCKNGLWAIAEIINSGHLVENN